MYWIKSTINRPPSGTYTLIITGLTNGNMADLTTAYIDNIFGGRSDFGDCILYDSSESILEYAKVSTIRTTAPPSTSTYPSSSTFETVPPTPTPTPSPTPTAVTYATIPDNVVLNVTVSIKQTKTVKKVTT